MGSDVSVGQSVNIYGQNNLHTQLTVSARKNLGVDYTNIPNICAYVLSFSRSACAFVLYVFTTAIKYTIPIRREKTDDID